MRIRFLLIVGAPTLVSAVSCNNVPHEPRSGSHLPSDAIESPLGRTPARELPRSLQDEPPPAPILSDEPKDPEMNALLPMRLRVADFFEDPLAPRSFQIQVPILESPRFRREEEFPERDYGLYASPIR